MKSNVSDIENGFALKRRHEKARGRGKKRKPVSEECTIPAPPVKHILSSFTLSNPTSKRAVQDYVESQARGEKVRHAEKIKSEHLFDRHYECWDVHTQRDRYWVITSPSNLYSQRFFPSLDFTLSFHVGVTTRIMALQRGAPDEAHQSRLTPVWRRWEEAAESYDAAEEAEDFQAVGMKCRVCLIHLGRSLGKPEMVPSGQELPQRDNFVRWSEHIANTVAPGETAERMRGHLKAIAKSAWELAGWLTHANGATRSDASFVLDAAQSVVAAYGSAVMRHESRSPERCPKCGSYSIGVGYNSELPRPYVSECEKCGWQSSEVR
jgi:predicted RNA-binding Zn-ribbon protein involved in translation (DUF1610 family)